MPGALGDGQWGARPWRRSGHACCTACRASPARVLQCARLTVCLFPRARPRRVHFGDSKREDRKALSLCSHAAPSLCSHWRTLLAAIDLACAYSIVSSSFSARMRAITEAVGKRGERGPAIEAKQPVKPREVDRLVEPFRDQDQVVRS